MKKINLLIIASIITIYGCTKKTEETVIAQTDLIESITNLNDSIFFGRILDIEAFNNKFFLSDQGSNKVIIVDDQFRFINSIGKTGPGPKEIKAISNIEVQDDRIIVQDAGGAKILIYNFDGDLIDTHDIYFESVEMEANSQYLFGQSVGETENPLVKYSLETGSKNNFGEPLEQTWNFFGRHLALVDSFIVDVNEINIPKIRVYNESGVLIKETDLSDHPLIKPWLDDLDSKEFLERTNSPLQKTQIVFRDIALVNGKLYLHMPPLGKKNGPKKSFVLEAEIEPTKEITIKKAYQFESNFLFRSFTVTEDGGSILGYDSGRGAIIKYKILNP